MKLAHPMWETPIEFCEIRHNILVIENPVLMRNYIEVLINQLNGKDGEFVLSDKDNILDVSKNLDIISDYFNIELNSKRALTRLYSTLNQCSMDGDMYILTSEIKSHLEQYIQNLIDNIDAELVYENDIDISGILKLMNVKFDDKNVSLCEKIISYFNIMRNYLGIKCFICVNIRSFLADNEIEMLYQYITYNKFNVLFIENQCPHKVFENEKLLIIDKDMCII